VVPLAPRRRWAVPLGIAASLGAVLLARPMLLPQGDKAALPRKNSPPGRKPASCIWPMGPA
jgi:hypothetical protein